MEIEGTVASMKLRFDCASVILFLDCVVTVPFFVLVCFFFWSIIQFAVSQVPSMPEEVICQSKDVGLDVSLWVFVRPLLFALIPPVALAFCSLCVISPLPFCCPPFLFFPS